MASNNQLQEDFEPSRATNSFREYLQNELIRRNSKNNGYSLRSFARALVLDPSSLARILKGERPLSNRMKQRLGNRLGLSEHELKRFVDQPEKPRLAIFNPLTLEAFSVISEWYFFAILEMVHLQDFRSDSRWMARRLCITVTEVSVAVERLIGLGLLRMKKGKLYGTGKNRTILNGPRTSAEQRRMQKQILEGALTALDEVPLENRHQSSMTMAIHTSRLVEAGELIKRFRRELTAVLEQDPERDEVYQLSVSLYPVTHNENKNLKEKRQ